MPISFCGKPSNAPTFIRVIELSEEIAIFLGDAAPADAQPLDRHAVEVVFVQPQMMPGDCR
jgi:hypothetical protein